MNDKDDVIASLKATIKEGFEKQQKNHDALMSNHDALMAENKEIRRQLTNIQIDLKNYHNSTKNVDKKFEGTIVLYREKGDPNTVIRIRKGQKKNVLKAIDDLEKEVDIKRQYHHIANPLLAFKMAQRLTGNKMTKVRLESIRRDMGTSCAYEIKDVKKRNELYQFLEKVDQLYQNPSLLQEIEELEDDDESFVTCNP